MELRQLEYFVAIAEAGSFSRAAERLSVTQPVLSRQIKALEQELGATLYSRTGRGIVLSEAGKLFEQHARGVLETAAGAKTALSALGAIPSGRVVIGMPPSVGAVLTAPLVREFRAAFPNVSLGVIEGFSGHVLEWLTNGRIDVAVLTGEWSNLGFRPPAVHLLHVHHQKIHPASMKRGKDFLPSR